MKFHVPEMSCSHCTATIEKNIRAKDPAADITTNLETRLVSVISYLPLADVQQSIADTGYEAKAI